MQPKTPTTFPHRAKRFQSYSMTPIDSQLISQSQFPNIKLNCSNNSNNVGSNRKAVHLHNAHNTNIVTNQFSYKVTEKLPDYNTQTFQNSERIRTQNRNRQKTEVQSNTYDSCQKNSRKMASSQILAFSTNNLKNSYINTTTMRNPIFVQNQTGLKTIVNSRIRGKQTRIPSFLLNKKRQVKKQQFQGNQSTTQRQQQQNVPMTQNFLSDIDKKIGQKQYKSIDSTNSIQTQGGQNVFSPPSNRRVSFSKVTTSTLSTNFQRQESTGTFKDFQEIKQIKQIQNSMEVSDNPNNLINQFENLFRRDQGPTKQLNGLQSQIAELFSNQDDQSEQFDEDLRHQLPLPVTSILKNQLNKLFH